MSNKVILYIMMASLGIGFLFVLSVTFFGAKEVSHPTQNLIVPSSEEEVLSLVLEISKLRVLAADAVLERGVSLRPVKEYALGVSVQGPAIIDSFEGLPSAEVSTQSEIEWWEIPIENIAFEYIKFEQENNNLLKNILDNSRGLIKSEEGKEILTIIEGRVVSSESQLRELAELLPK